VDASSKVAAAVNANRVRSLYINDPPKTRIENSVRKQSTAGPEILPKKSGFLARFHESAVKPYGDPFVTSPASHQSVLVPKITKGIG
jgi:hypothetical protein